MASKISSVIYTTSGKIVPDHHKCPICTILPDDKVFQCLNGHILCEDCKQKLKSCPQCRILFGPKIARCLVMENLLDEFELRCAYQENGCEEKLNRKSFNNHHKVCIFRPVNLCKKLGEKCPFKIEKENLAEGLKHLREVHEWEVTNSLRENINISESDREELENSGICFLRILRREECKDGVFIILIDFDREEKKVSWGAYYWMKQTAAAVQDAYQVRLTISSGEGKHSVTWTTSLNNIFETEDDEDENEESVSLTPMYLPFEQFGKVGTNIDIEIYKKTE